MDLSLLAWGSGGWGDELFRGMLMTLALAVTAFPLGILFGTIVGSARLSPYKPVAAAAEVYTTVIRGIPDLVLLYILFFGGSQLFRWVLQNAFGYEGYVELNAFAICVIAFSIINGAYSAEVIRGAIQALPPGEIEAARAIGMSRGTIVRRIMVPQVLRLALPGLANVWQLLLKEVALASLVGLEDLMRSARVASGSTREPFTFYFSTLIIFWLIALKSGFWFERAEAWANKGVRRAV